MLKQERRKWDNGRNIVDGKMGLGYTEKGGRALWVWSSLEYLLLNLKPINSFT
jgi:hypothetical protein